MVWGSPHVELADGSESRARHGPAAAQKAHAFGALSRQFPNSFVLVLYAGHGVEALRTGEDRGRGDHCGAEAVLRLPALLRPAAGLPERAAEGGEYYPRHSKGSLRTTGRRAPVRALLRAPLTWTAVVPWTTALVPASGPDRDGCVGQVLDVYALVSMLAKEDGYVLFLGEERADLSGCCAAHHLHRR